MYGMPQDMMGPAGFDPSIVMLSGYLLTLLAGLITLALLIGAVTLPIFFVVLFAIEQGAWAVAGATGAFVPKLVLIMFRGLRRSPLRTSLTYLALFVLTTVLVFLYTILTFINTVTTEKEANFKAILTHKTVIPSQMPPKHYTEFKRLALEELPKEYAKEYPGEPALVVRDQDVISWSFVGGTTDPKNMRPDNVLFMFCLEPEKILTMMDGLDDLTGDEKAQLEAGVKAMLANEQAIIVSKSRLKKLNKEVGQEIKLTGLNFPKMEFKFDIIGVIPDGKYEGVGFMNKAYLEKLLKDKPADYVMQDKAVNLIWVKLPNRKAFDVLNRMVDPPANPPPGQERRTSPFNSPALKMETASSGIGSWLDAYKDIFFGMKYILTPAMVAIMCLVIANAISIGVRERRTEMAVLKVLGFQPRHVLALVLGEAVLVGLMAGGMAAFLSWFGIGNLKLQIAFFGAFIVPWEALVLGPLLGVVVSVLGSIGPALGAKNVKVAEVFARVA
ncbi:ABC transporter permease [Gemmata sp. G18]|uniref:ABC transporter permease n=1 Tax=Gemmata palustris TaxID=2822762 RepID=A0ABS5BYV5_9BACT|nr:FtsX-like permease family protein [Gemmata palustris]MBP3958845.1 ABC transporter permease [Gemmata palustris]